MAEVRISAAEPLPTREELNAEIEKWKARVEETAGLTQSLLANLHSIQGENLHLRASLKKERENPVTQELHDTIGQLRTQLQNERRRTMQLQECTSNIRALLRNI